MADALVYETNDDHESSRSIDKSSDGFTVGPNGAAGPSRT